jgi:excisionase family DNA binding protein
MRNIQFTLKELAAQFSMLAETISTTFTFEADEEADRKATFLGQLGTGEGATPAEAAEFLGVTDRQVRNLCEAGTLDAKNVGRRWVISRSSLVALRLSRQAQSKGSA